MLTSIYEMVRKIRYDDKGATAIEYGLIAGLISVVIVGVLTTTGGSLSGIFTTISNALSAAK